MLNVSKALAIGFAAVTVTSGAFAQEAETVKFRYDKTATIEANYSDFKRTARRACDDGSILYSHTLEQACRADLLDQAVPATKQDAFIAYHEQMVALAI